MKVEIINSGSKGNCAVIDDEIIIDAGWNCTPKGNVLLLTHNHSDHTKFLDKMQGLPIYCLKETADKLKDKFPYTSFGVLTDTQRIRHEADECVYDIRLVGVVHDVPCVGFDIYRHGYRDEDDKRIFWATDYNSFKTSEEETFIKCLKNKVYDALYLECNNTLDETSMLDIYIGTEVPKDEFHRRRSYQSHCNVEYLIGLFKRAGYSAENRFTEPVTLLHKSSYYYNNNVERILELCKIANVKNPIYE